MPPANRPLKPGDRLPKHSFGVVGVDTWDRLETGRNETLGIVRDVQSDHDGGSVAAVSYVFGEVAGKSTCPWKRAATAGRWELDLKTSRDPQSMPGFASLEKLSQIIRGRFQKTGRLPQDDDDLRSLDLVIDGMLKNVMALHAERQTVGLLSPTNIITFLDDNRKLRVLLTDAGFRWQGAPPLPTWLGDMEQKWSDLWHPAPGAIFQRRPWSEDAQVEDLRLIARMCFWVLTGTVENADQAVVDHFGASASNDADSGSATCWQVLYQTLTSKKTIESNGLRPVTTVAEFAEKLKRAPLSNHFRQPRRIRRPGFTGKVVSVAALLVAFLAGIAYVGFHPDWVHDIVSRFAPDVTPPNRLCPDCKYPSALLPVLNDYLPLHQEVDSRFSELGDASTALHDERIGQLIDQLTTMWDLLARMRQAMATSEGDRAAEHACVDKLTDQIRTQVNQLGEAFVQAAREGNVVEQREFGRRIVELFDQTAGSSESKPKEKPAWYEIIRSTLLGA